MASDKQINLLKSYMARGDVPNDADELKRFSALPSKPDAYDYLNRIMTQPPAPKLKASDADYSAIFEKISRSFRGRDASEAELQVWNGMPPRQQLDELLKLLGLLGAEFVNLQAAATPAPVAQKKPGHDCDDLDELLAGL